MKEVTEEGCVGTINFSDGRLHHHLFPHIVDSDNSFSQEISFSRGKYTAFSQHLLRVLKGLKIMFGINAKKCFLKLQLKAIKAATSHRHCLCWDI